MKLPESNLATLADDRCLSIETLEQAGIRLVTDEDSPYAGWWQIPYPHRNGIWKHRYRNPDSKGRPKYKDEPGAPFHLYNPLRLGPNEEEVWFCEGEFDTLCLVEIGLDVIGIHGVDNVGEEESKSRFRAEWRWLFEDTLNIVMFDNDDAGRTAGRRLATALNGVVFDAWDDRFSDVNEWMCSDRLGLEIAIGKFRRRVRQGRGLE